MRRAQGSTARHQWETGHVRLAATFPLFCCALLLLSLFVGCSPSNRVQQVQPASEDPLVGGCLPKQSNLGPIGPQSAHGSALPPLPQAVSVSATAALAGGDPLAGGKQLAIPAAARIEDNSWRTPGQSKDALITSQPGAATLHAPEMLPAVPIAPVSQPGGPTSTAKAGPSTPTLGGSEYEHLQTALRARGVSWQRQETYRDGFKFTCSVPNLENPDFSRVYEATARDYASAIRAVIEQIDRNR